MYPKSWLQHSLKVVKKDDRIVLSMMHAVLLVLVLSDAYSVPAC